MVKSEYRRWRASLKQSNAAVIKEIWCLETDELFSYGFFYGLEKMSELEQLLVSATDAARILGIGRTKFYEMHLSGRLGPMAIQFGRRKVWRVADLRAWVKIGCPYRDDWLAKGGQK